MSKNLQEDEKNRLDRMEKRLGRIEDMLHAIIGVSYILGEILLQKADKALYAVKSQGKNHVLQYQDQFAEMACTKGMLLMFLLISCRSGVINLSSFPLGKGNRANQRWTQ